MSQPKWKAVAQLGDVNPLDHGGYWVLEDKTGGYSPEAELLCAPQDGEGRVTYTVYRFVLENCTYVNGVLSDNEYHPEYPVWFANKLDDLAAFSDVSVPTLLDWFLSGESKTRAQAWRIVGEYFGFLELDHYPLELTRSEVTRRYRKAQYKVGK